MTTKLNPAIFWLLLAFIGASLLVVAWFSSYPLSIDSSSDVLFNHVSPLYWVGLSIFLVSLYELIRRSQSKNLKCALTIVMVLSMFSLPLFYYTLSGSDWSYFRGLTEYYLKTNDLTPNALTHGYYQWPSYFIFSKMFLEITDLSLRGFEFLMYILLGVLWTSGLYYFTSKNQEKFGFLSVITFSIAMFLFLDYQAVPFSFAFSFLVLFLMREKTISAKKGKSPFDFLSLVLFVGACFFHFFVPVFFLLYAVIRFLITRTKRNLTPLFLYLAIYLVVQIFQASLSFSQYTLQILNNFLSSDLQRVVAYSFVQPISPLHAIPQTLSRIDVILVVSICGIGFLIYFVKKAVQTVDVAVFLSGVIYIVTSLALPILGQRAFPLVFIPVSMGILYFSKIRKFLNYFMVFILICFIFVPISQTFNDSQIQFETKGSYFAENFMINNYPDVQGNVVLAHIRVTFYLQIFMNNPHFINDQSFNITSIFSRNIDLDQIDGIFYSIGLAKSLERQNLPIQDLTSNSDFHLTYDDGLSKILCKVK